MQLKRLIFVSLILLGCNKTELWEGQECECTMFTQTSYDVWISETVESDCQRDGETGFDGNNYLIKCTEL